MELIVKRIGAMNFQKQLNGCFFKQNNTIEACPLLFHVFKLIKKEK
jgi:hypothetical protein